MWTPLVFHSDLLDFPNVKPSSLFSTPITFSCERWISCSTPKYNLDYVRKTTLKFGIESELLYLWSQYHQNAVRCTEYLRPRASRCQLSCRAFPLCLSGHTFSSLSKLGKSHWNGFTSWRSGGTRSGCATFRGMPKQELRTRDARMVLYIWASSPSMYLLQPWCEMSLILDYFGFSCRWVVYDLSIKHGMYPVAGWYAFYRTTSIFLTGFSSQS